MILVSAIWIKDLARAFAVLQPADDETRMAIARLLLPKLTSSVQERPTTEPRQLLGGEGSRTGLAIVTELAKTEAAQSPGPEQARRQSTTVLLRPVSREVGKQFVSWKISASLEPAAPHHLDRIRDHLPLFEPRWTPSLVAATVSTDAQDGPPDVERMVEELSQGRPIMRVRTRSRPSLFRGVQLLIDIGEGMEPFTRDQEELAEELRHVVGKSAVMELRFRDCPNRGAGQGPIWTWGPYQTPVPGTPVLALTNLGLGGPRLSSDRSSLAEWLSVAQRLHRQLSPLIALVPYPKRRWPSAVVRAMTIVPWDRSTTIAKVRAIVGPMLIARG